MIHVLIVDDSVFMRTILSDILSRNPSIEVVGFAANGIEALQKIEETTPDVITLDIQMPKMDGLATLKALQSFSRKPKILILSTLSSKDAVLTKEALRLGADDFFLKPRNLTNIRGVQDEITAKIRHLISLPERQEKSNHSKDAAQSIVLVGSSAGGPPMLDTLLSSLKSDLAAALVITQHMPEGFTAALAERLNRISALPVKESVHGEILKQGSVTISKAGYHSIISGVILPDKSLGGKITHSQAPPMHAVRPAIDMTFSSAAKIFKGFTISALLSGMGSDGAEGSCAVKQAGGKTLVVEEKDCLVYGMARSSLARGCIDTIVPIRRLSCEIMDLVSGLEG